MKKPSQSIKLRTSSALLSIINYSEGELASLGLNGQDLFDIYLDFLKKQDELQEIAEMISNTLMRSRRVHSIRYRIKDPIHLIRKVIRKKKESSERVINKENYLEQVTDLIGLRALHLYKEEWRFIGNHISETWDLHEEPVAYYRTGDSSSYLEHFEKYGCKVKEHKAGYRSVHYIIKTKPNKLTFFAEIQVRTIFEEGWSEIDHDVRYPDNTDNTLFNDLLQILNRLCGSADEFGSYLKNLQYHLDKNEFENITALQERDDKIRELEAVVDQLSINKPQKEEIKTKISDIVEFQNKKYAVLSNSLGNSLPFSVLPPGLSTLMNATAGIEKTMGALSGLSKINESSTNFMKNFEAARDKIKTNLPDLNSNTTKD